MKDKIKGSIYNRMFEFLMKHRAADVIRAVNASSTAIQREQKAKHILDWYINNAGEMEPLTDEQLAAVKETWKDIWDTGVQRVMKQHPEMAKMNESSVNTIRIIAVML